MSNQKQTAAAPNMPSDKTGDLKRYPVEPLFFAVATAWISGADTPQKIAEYLDMNRGFFGYVMEDYKRCPPPGAEEILYLLKAVRVRYVEEQLDDLIPQMPSDMSSGEPSGAYVYFAEDAHCIVLEFDEEDKDGWTEHAVDVFAYEGCIASSDDYGGSSFAKHFIRGGADYCLAPDTPKLQEAATAAFVKPKVPAAVANMQMPGPGGTVKSLCVSALPVSAMNRRSLGLWKDHACTIFRAQVSYAKDGVETRSHETYYLSSLHFEDPAIARYGLDAIRFHEPNPPCARIYLNFGSDGLRAKNRIYDQNAAELNSRAKQICDMVGDELKKENKTATPAKIKRILSMGPELVFPRYGDLLILMRAEETRYFFGGSLFDEPDEEDEEEDWL